MSEAKLKEGIFVGPQIPKILLVENVDRVQQGMKRTAWKTFKSIATNFQGNGRAKNYRKLAEDLLEADKYLRYKISLKIDFRNSHLVVL